MDTNMAELDELIALLAPMESNHRLSSGPTHWSSGAYVQPTSGKKQNFLADLGSDPIWARDQAGRDQELPGLGRCVVPGNPYLLHCFPAHITELTNEHRDHLDRIVIKIVESYLDQHPISEVHIVGHSATWRGIRNDEYAHRAISRAKNAKTYLEDLLAEHRLAGKVKVTIEGQSNDEPLIDNMVHSSSRKARRNRALNRRVEIRMTRVQSPSPGPARKVFKTLGSDVADANAYLADMTASAGVCTDDPTPGDVFGADDRSPIRSNVKPPHRWICKIVSFFPSDSSGNRIVTEGTGFIFDLRRIVTAGHNLQDMSDRRMGNADSVLVIPALDKQKPAASSAIDLKSMPFGAFLVRKRVGRTSNFFISPENAASGTLNPETDYGVILYSRRKTLRTGKRIRDGWSLVVKSLADIAVDNIRRQAKRPAQPKELIRLLRLNSRRFSVAGYGHDRPCRQLVHRRARLLPCRGSADVGPSSATSFACLPETDRHNFILNNFDTVSGNSGSPCWITKRNSRGKPMHILCGVLHGAEVDEIRTRGGGTIELDQEDVMTVLTPVAIKRIRDLSHLHGLT